MSTALYVKLFNQFKEITEAARSAVSRHIQPLLEGFRVSGENDEMLTDLFEEWQAGCRASAAGLQRTLYPNEEAKIPKMPNDDEEHQPCRQMAAVLIERTIYDEHIAQRWFQMAVNNIKNHPKCATHPKTCACKMALEGWLHAANQIQVYHLNVFYEAHYEHEKDEAYIQAVRAVAKLRGRTFEQQMEHERRARAEEEEDVHTS